MSMHRDSDGGDSLCEFAGGRCWLHPLKFASKLAALRLRLRLLETLDRVGMWPIQTVGQTSGGIPQAHRDCGTGRLPQTRSLRLCKLLGWVLHCRQPLSLLAPT